MSEIIEKARKWLSGENDLSGCEKVTSHLIIESLLSEIQRVEAANAKVLAEFQRLKTDGAKELRLSVAEECAVICETADYVVRSYGCAHEIRKKFGLSTQAK